MYIFLQLQRYTSLNAYSKYPVADFSLIPRQVSPHLQRLKPLIPFVATTNIASPKNLVQQPGLFFPCQRWLQASVLFNQFYSKMLYVPEEAEQWRHFTTCDMHVWPKCKCNRTSFSNQTSQTLKCFSSDLVWNSEANTELSYFEMFYLFRTIAKSSHRDYFELHRMQINIYRTMAELRTLTIDIKLCTTPWIVQNPTNTALNLILEWSPFLF